MGVAAALQAPSWRWLVEDAAISFAYARNLADGWGLVPYPGLERVEGYSNPTWVALVALAEAVGLHAFDAARWLGLVLGLALVPVLHEVGRRVEAPLLVATVAATSFTAALWAQSGLENPLLLLLLGLGTWRLAVEVEGRRGPASALIFALVAMTRPEGLGYGLAAGAVLTLAELLHHRSVKRSLAWWAALCAPLAVFEAARIAYFALPLPATYYAKLGKLPTQISDWDLRGWKQVRGWMLETGLGPLLPIVLVGLTGAHGWRLGVALASSAAIAVAVLLPHVVEPPGFDTVRLVVFGLVVVALSLATIGRPGWTTRLVCLGYAVFAFAFTVRSKGDWMFGYRFLSPAVVPAAVLLGAGLAEIRAALRSGSNGSWTPWSRAIAAATLAIWCGGNLWMAFHVDRDTSPHGVRRRLNHYYAVFERMHLERPFLAVDHDMGGMMWWHDPTRGRVIDARGLVDLPFALHQSQRPFVREYLFEHQTFDLAHGHASTGRALRKIPRFAREYVEVEGYGRFGREHGGNFLRRDLFLRASWDGPGPSTTFGGEVELVGLALVAPEVAPGTELLVEVAVRARVAHRLLVFLHGPEGRIRSWDLPPAYGWVPPEDWRPGEIFVGRFALRLPDDLPLGDYDLGFVVFGPDGAVLPADGGAGGDAGDARLAEGRAPTTSDGATGADDPAAPGADGAASPRFARGESLFEGAVRLRADDEVEALAEGLREEALASAAGGACAEAEASWERALRHRMGVKAWQRKRRAVAREIAGCWARSAASLPDPLEQARRMDQARRWDVRAPVVHEVGARLADAAWPEAMAARAAGDAERAFWLFDAVVRLDPSRAWARRYAEEARAVRLGLELGFGVDGAEEAPERDGDPATP